MKEKIKAVALFSGGLDSTLAAKIMEQHGIDVIAVHFITPFCGKVNLEDCKEPQDTIAKEAGLKIVHELILKEYLEIVKHPKFGYGKNMNPCIDCKILFLKRVWQLGQELGAHFIITGEVLDQRPMSQRMEAIKLIEEEAGVSGLVVRPLCGKFLPPTIPEEKGWIEREWLLNIRGRSRKRQLELAKKLGIKNFTQPAGGCLLTDPTFSIRLRELMEHEGLDLIYVNLLKLGRHFRLADNVRLVVGRNQVENSHLRQFKDDFVFIEPLNTKGPDALLSKEASGEDLGLALKIVARYCDDSTNVIFKIRFSKDKSQEITVEEPLPPQEVERYRIG